MIPSFATPLVTRVLLLALAGLLVMKACVFAGLTPAGKTALTDFDAFHIVGRMVWRGDVLDAYHFATMMTAQRELGGAQGFMPWTYPPPFDLVVALLACLPLGLAYLVFTGLTLGAFLLVLRRIARDAFRVVLLAVYPALVVTVGCGQNGFLSGTLIGLAALALARGHAGAGVPLGLMVFKPHLAVAFAIYAVARRRWACIALAVGVAALACGLATGLLGPSVWPAFVEGVAEAKTFLVAGDYPFHRMTSVYATLRSLDVPAALAFTMQGIVALAASAMVVTAIRRRLQPARILGFTALASLLVSPYAYDYDLTIYGIALSFLMPEILRLGTACEQVAIMGLSLFTCAYGVVSNGIIEWARTPGQGGAGYDLAIEGVAPSAAGVTLLVVAVLLWRVLGRESNAVATGPGVMGPIARTGLLSGPAREAGPAGLLAEHRAL